jgi:HSP20 family protein
MPCPGRRGTLSVRRMKRPEEVPMALVQFDPFATLESMERDLNRMLQRVSGRDSGWTPAIDLKHVGDDVIARIDLPGMKEEDVSVEVADGMLTVSGERADEHEETKGTWYHRERLFGSFSRSFSIPAGVDPTKITAEFADGVLEVTMPGTPQPKPKRVPVTARRKKEEKAKKAVAVH